MGKTDRGHFTISTNVILTFSAITRTLTFGLTMLIAYMKSEDAIFDDNVIRIMNLDSSYGMPMGSSMRSIAYSMIGVFLMEFVTGVFGTFGVLCRMKSLLIITVLLSSFMLITYTVYIVILAFLYDKTNTLYDALAPYSDAFWKYSTNHYYNYWYVSNNYRSIVFPGFLSKLGCGTDQSELLTCQNVYKEQVRTYLKTYFGVIITCILCHAVSIVASEYTYRKFEFKEKKTGLSRNKYYILLSLRHGIGRKFVLFVRRAWRASKIIFFSTVLKVISLIVSLGLFGLGLSLTGDVMITNFSLKYIFYQIQFNQYYFYDILVGLAASSVVIGFLGAASSVLSMIGSWRRSSMPLIVSCATSSSLLIPKLVVLVFGSFLIVKINNNMKYQLRNQQNGYYYNHHQNTITTEWNDMIMVLNCCGVYSPNDTYSNEYGRAFCCNFANEFILDPYGYYSHNNYGFNYFYGCGGFKTKTCTSVVLSKTRMYFGWFLAIVLLSIIVEIIAIIFTNKEYHVRHCNSSTDGSRRRRIEVLKSLVVVYAYIWTGLKSFLRKYCSRSNSGRFHFVAITVLFACSISLLSNAVRIRYDVIFGNRDIRPMLSRVNITDTTFTDAIDNFSTVVTTFALASVVAMIYSIVIMIPQNINKLFTFVSITMWACLIIANVIELGLWSKFHTDVSSELTMQFESDINMYRYSQRSGLSYYDQLSFYWNTLFVKAMCCGTNSTSNLTFQESYWYKHGHHDYSGQVLPLQCCTTQIDVYPYDHIDDNSCRPTANIYHEEDCPTAIDKRLKDHYSIPFFVLTSIVLVSEIVLIITTLKLLRNKISDDELLSLKNSQELNPMDENNVKITQTVTNTNTKPTKIKRANSRTSGLLMSRKVEPETNVVEGKDNKSNVSNESRIRRERSRIRKKKKAVDKIEAEIKETSDKELVARVKTETEINEKTEDGFYGSIKTNDMHGKGQETKPQEKLQNENDDKDKTERVKNENGNNINTEAGLHDSMGDNPATDKVQGAAPEEPLSTITGYEDGNIGRLTSAWQTSDNVRETSIKSFNPNTGLRSSIPEGSISSAFESMPSENRVEMTNDVDFEEL